MTEKQISAEEFDQKFENGEDVSPYVDWEHPIVDPPMTKWLAGFALIFFAFLICLCASEFAFADTGDDAFDDASDSSLDGAPIINTSDEPSAGQTDTSDALLLTQDADIVGCADTAVTLAIPETDAADNSDLFVGAPLSAAPKASDAPDISDESTPSTLAYSGNYFARLNNNEINYTDATVVTQQFVSADGDGIFLLNGAQLSFYSLDTGKCTSVYNFGSCSDAYVANGLLYVLTGSTECQIYDLSAQKITGTLQIQGMRSATAVGADSQGRIYVAGTAYNDSSKLIYPVKLYSSSGNLLSEMESDALVYAFSGFESDTGRFFMESYYNWTYWGYSHPGRGATMGVVTDNVIESFAIRNQVVVGSVTYTLNCIDYMCQSDYYLHQRGSDLIGDRYFVTASTTFGRVQIVDAENLTIVADLGRAGFEYTASDDTMDVGSIGVRTVYNEAHNSIIFYANNHELTEYSMDTGEELNSYTTQYNVFNLLMQDDEVYIIEKENNAYYLEVVDWSDPDSISINAQNTTLKVGDTETLSVDVTGNSLSGSYVWTSSDDSIVTVTSAGRIAAWSEGTATVTATTKNGLLSASIEITVVSNGRAMPVAMQTVAGGALTNTVSDNNYTTWSSPMYSAMYQSSSGSLVRVEYTNGEVLVEEWSTDAALLSSRTLSCELPIYGGFYSGSDYNFLVFGQNNPDESDSCEVMRIVKYSKSWERLGACSVYGANTYIPFDAGSLRMTEAGSNLYIYTCHEMYDSDGSGTHHQANMTFVVNKSSMSVQQSYSDVMNISVGYVSHSFNQFVQADDTYLYRVDHGDAYPRAVSITRCSLNGSIENVSYTYALSILGSTGANATGVSVGGFELSTDNCIIAGNSVDQSSSSTYSASGQRNIFVSITDKAFSNTNVVWLTDYTSDDGITPRTPQLVKLDDEHFLVMWEEVNSNTKATTTRVATINSEGVVTQNYSTRLRLSDCQPILTSDGYVCWYATDGTDVTLYSIDPYQLITTCPASPFIDVSDPNEWYYDSVCYMANLGLINGYAPDYTIFGVGDDLTRADLVTIMWRYCEPEEFATYDENTAVNETDMPDVENHTYYTGAVNWATENGVITGYTLPDGSYLFGANDPVTFDMMVTIVARYALGGVNEAAEYPTDSLFDPKFTDAAAVEDWACGSMAWAIDNEVVNGGDNGNGTYTLAPLEDVARERAATVLARSIQSGLITAS